MIVYSLPVILMFAAVLFVVGAMCVGLFTTFAKSHGMRVAVPSLIISLLLLFAPLTQLEIAGFRGFHLSVFVVVLLSVICLWKNKRKPLSLILPVVTVGTLIYVWLNWPTSSPSPFRSNSPEGTAGVLFLIFTLGGASILAFLLYVQCHPPLKKKTEQ